MIKKIKKILKKKKRKTPLKERITIRKEGMKVALSMVFSDPDYKVHQLWAQRRLNPDEKKLLVSLKEPTNTPRFEFNITELLTCGCGEEDVYDLYLETKIKTSTRKPEFVEKKRELAKFTIENSEEYMSYFIRLGGFDQTDLDLLEPSIVDGNKIHLSQTVSGNLSVYVNGQIKPKIRLQIESIKQQKEQVIVKGIMFTQSNFIVESDAYIQIRASANQFKQHVQLIRDEAYSLRKLGNQKYAYEIAIDLNSFRNKNLEDQVFDLYLAFKFNNGDEDVYVKKVGRPTNRAKLLLEEMVIEGKDVSTVISPYFTFKQQNLSFETYNVDADAYKVLKHSMKHSKKIFEENKKRDIWLIGERPYKAQDTGFRFFEYMRKQHPEKEVYYVIDRNSIERANVEPLGNVLYYKSKEHIEKTMQATKIVSSHHADYLYPIRTKKYKKKVQAVKVFLQHGVMGTKNMVSNYGKFAKSGFDTDLFIVSSDFEKGMIVSDFGYAEKEVVVTGLSRFDALFTKDVPLKRQILIIPTWRDWITSEQVFLESDYFHRYQELVNSVELHALSEKYQFDILFCLHPNMQKYSKFFESSAVRVINQGEVDVQHLIKESALMVTDYSSVGFDFSFLHKPIVYYQFDRRRFIGKRPSHLNIDRDLPGVIVDQNELVISEIEKYAAQNFVMEDEYVQRANKFIKYRDTSACDRIFEAVKSATKFENKWDDFATSTVGSITIRQLKKRKMYYPIMKFAYKVMLKTVKVDKNLILFESGVGKQYADSPRVIYEEIVRQNLPYKKVWVYNGLLPIKDEHTRRISRLSPKYYYYLAKAGYWVNNQNFPTYLDKNKKTTYLQTWHGTPLKKMQFDMDHVTGRDDGYLSRVHHATQTWDYLISPSEYATNAFRSAFRYDGEVLQTGYPRNDIFYQDHEQIKEKVMNKLNLPRDKKIVLYAPTFRDNQTAGKKGKFSFKLELDLQRMQEALGDDYIVLLRMHVVVSNSLTIPEEYREMFKNVSKYPDIQELYLISDVLMTDYSSVMFDFANTKRPILYYTYDFADYRDNLRGFYIDFEAEAPGPLLETTDEVIHALQNIEEVQRDYATKYDAFQEKYCSLEDGEATKRVVEKIFK